MKIGILSAAHVHADQYVTCLKSISDIEIIGIADHENERGQLFARKYGLHYYSTYEELIERRPDGVIITSENAFHADLVKKAARARINILCEKPLATKVHDAQEMVQTCKDHSVILMTAFPMRFSPPVSNVKSELESGSIGQMRCFNGSNQGQLPPRDRAWFTDPDLAGGGAITDHLVHLADILRWYTGSDVKEVYAVSNRIFHADEVQVETGAMVSLSFENNVFATIDCSWSRPESWPSWGGLSFDVITDRGAVHVDAFKQNLTLYKSANIDGAAAILNKGGGSQGIVHDWAAEQSAIKMLRNQWLFWGSDANKAMIREFITAIKEARQPAVTGDDGLAAVRIVDAAYRSIKEKRVVSV